ncbi:phosphotransferase [Gardnerella sp. Marseille-Q9179]|uniref:phosphotransferase n=1 Tax=Gardnerella sp. Marseille-Q9179 TaxID=3383028 RepID=UPI003AF46583
MPEVQFAGTRQSEQVNATDTAAGISHAVVQDISGKLYDVFISADSKGRKRLRDRARAAWTLEHSKDLAALGFAYDTMLTFMPGKREDANNNAGNVANNVSAGNSTVAGTQQYAQQQYAQQQPTQQQSTRMSSIIANDNDEDTVLVCEHLEGSARDLRLLTTDDCANVGTAIGAIHRLRPTFVTRGKYPAFTTGQIRAQLTGWIKRLRQAGHIPTEITDSWSRVLETEGLWSFETCPVHGGFMDGDILFAGSTITAVTNWQRMQINDPARDLAWIFAKLNEQRRNAVLSAYGRIMGSRLDSLIMLRANLWLQMEQVGDFVQALQRADNTSIMRFKAQVERLAHELSRISNAQAAKTGRAAGNPASTITVGTLLENDNTQSRQISKNNSAENQLNAGNSDETNERDITSEGNTELNNAQDETYDSNKTISDDTHERKVQYAGTHAANAEEAEKAAQLADDTATQVITHVETQTAHETAETIVQTAMSKSADSDANDKPENVSNAGGAEVAESKDEAIAESDSKVDSANETSSDSNTSSDSKLSEDAQKNTREDYDKPETVIIPLLEREERAMRDAQADLD